ncbi:hypothetical protein MWMV18_MWMV18_03588 [Acinetobacter calcoaceticus]|nr:hypothetical protein MWMV18_MWMV18_03588 [Acinetobacter calcoaceticus]
MKNRLFSIFLSFSLIFSSVVHANTIAYDTSMKIGKTWKVARTFIKNNPLGKSPQGFILAVSSVYLGDKLVTEYQNGTFDAPLASMKQSIAEMFVAGVSATGWLREQFSSLSKKFNCVSGLCTSTADIYSATISGVYFRTQNGTQKYSSLNSFVQSEVFDKNAHTGFNVIGVLGGENELTSILQSNVTGGSIVISVHVTCRTDGTWCGSENGVPKPEDVINTTVIVVKPDSKPVNMPATVPVSTSDIVKDVSEPLTEQQQVEVIATCFLTNCSSIQTNRSDPQSIPTSYLPNGQSIDQKYPSPPLVLNPDGSVNDATGSTVEGTDQSDSTIGEKPTSIPEFCKWAKPVCDLKEWFTADNIPEPEQINIQDFDSSKVPEAKVWSVGNQQCPPSPSFNLGALGSFTLEIGPFCDFLSSIRGFVIASAYLGAAFIIFNYRRS